MISTIKLGDGLDPVRQFKAMTRRIMRSEYNRLWRLRHPESNKKGFLRYQILKVKMAKTNRVMRNVRLAGRVSKLNFMFGVLPQLNVWMAQRNLTTNENK